MSVSPPRDLSRQFDHATILASAGISVKGNVPDVGRCPLCGRDDLAIHPDPLDVSGNWMYCHNCGECGDPLDFYSKIHGLSKLPMEVVLSKAISDGMSLGPIDNGAEAAASYQVFPDARAATAQVWNTLQKQLSEDTHPDVVRRLQSEHFWGSYGRATGRRFWRFLGGGIRREVDKLFDKRVLPADASFHTAMVVNYQDLPGRTCMLELRSEAGESVLKSMIVPALRKREGGLAMLEVLRPSEGTVFAIGNPVMGLQLQRLWLNVSSEPLKMVVFNDETNLSWSTLRANKVVLWNSEINWRIFDHARKVEKAHIALDPAPRKRGNDLYAYISEMSPSTVLDIMARSAKPWAEVFADWATNPDTPQHVVHEAVNQLAFSVSDRTSILDKCSTPRRQRLEYLLGDVKVAQKAVFNGKNIVEMDKGWWIFYSASSREQLTDVIVKLHKEITERHSGKIHWAGSIRFKEKVIPFNDPLEEIEGDTEKWLRKHTIAHGLGTPFIKLNWAKQLRNIARTFSTPQSVTSDLRLGLQANGEFVMPRFRLCGGTAIEEKAVAYTAGTPGVDVLAPVWRKPRSGDSFNLGRAAFVATGAAFMTNQLRRMRGMGPQPVAMAGSITSVARAAARGLAEGLGMSSHVLALGQRNPAAFLEQLKRFDYPAYAEPSDMRRLSSFPSVTSCDLYLSCNEAEALALASGSGWMGIIGPQVKDDPFAMPPIDDLLCYILALQERKFVFEEGPCLPITVCRDFAKWYAGYMALDEQRLSAAALAMLYVPTVGEALLDLFVCLVRRGNLALKHDVYLPALLVGKASPGDVVVDDHESKVFLSRTSLERAMRKLSLPKPDFSIASTDLLQQDRLRPCGDQNEGWVIEAEYWEERVRSWQNRLAIQG